jgi:hypothetical protein
MPEFDLSAHGIFVKQIYGTRRRTRSILRVNAVRRTRRSLSTASRWQIPEKKLRVPKDKRIVERPTSSGG